MLLHIYSMYDSAAKAYTVPFYAQSDGVAWRLFADKVNDPETVVGKHPEQFTLYLIGHWDDENGSITSDEAVSLCNGRQVKEDRIDVDDITNELAEIRRAIQELNNR